MILQDMNLTLSIIGAISVAALFVVVRRGTTYFGVVQEPARKRGQVHAKVGSFVLLMYALLGITSAVGAWMTGPQDYLSVVAVGFRVIIVITLVSWVAWEVDAHVHGRYPKLDNAVDWLLTFGHHVDTKTHQH